MGVRNNPVPDHYYINLSGQLIRVRALVYVQGEARQVWLEYLDGRKVLLGLEEWCWLQLSQYPDWFNSDREDAERETEL